MAHVLVRLTVEDFDRWLPVFEESAALRRSYSSKGARVFRSLDQPNAVVIVAEYADAEQARRLFQSPEFREAIRRAGVIGKPETTLLDEVAQVDA
jgi:quinol monooxygenase YgiN